MTKNIRNLWDLMTKKTQAKALAVLMTEFGLTSSTYVKQTWIWKGDIPEEDQPKVISIFQKVLLEQSKNAIEFAKSI